MDAIIGKYRARIEETGLMLKHTSGITFELSIEETLGILDFLNAYRQTLLALQGEKNTDPEVERIVLDKDED